MERLPLVLSILFAIAARYSGCFIESDELYTKVYFVLTGIAWVCIFMAVRVATKSVMTKLIADGAMFLSACEILDEFTGFADKLQINEVFILFIVITFTAYRIYKYKRDVRGK
jgi:hypothetical protein